MKEVCKTAASLMLAVIPYCGICAAEAPRFERISPHFYMLAGENGSANVGAVVTDAGILLVNPPDDQRLPAVLDNLRSVAPKRVRWCVYTDSRHRPPAGTSTLSRQGTAVFISQDIKNAAVSSSTTGDADAQPAPAGTELVFQRQMHLFPDNLEVRFASLGKKWQDGGSVTVFVPAEKVLMVGDIFTEGSLPRMENGSGRPGALLWLDAMKEVIDSIPLLKSAMPPPKPDPAKPPEEPKTLEELIAVVPSTGPPSTLQAMKDLLAQGQKMRGEIARAVSQRRNRNSFYESAVFAPFRNLGNFEGFAVRLYDELKNR